MKTAVSFALVFSVTVSVGIFAQVNTEVFRLDADSAGFSVRSELNATIMAGNTDFQYAGTETRFNVNHESGYTFLVVNGGYGKEDGRRFFSQTLLHLRNVHSVNRGVQMEQFFQYDTNKKRLLASRYLIGWGYRFKLHRNENVKTRMGASVFYEREDYTLAPDAGHPAHDRGVRMNTYVTILLQLSGTVSMLNTTYLQPRIPAVRDYRVLSDFALNVSLGKVVNLVTTCSFRYDSRPADGIKEMDVITKSGIALQIK